MAKTYETVFELAGKIDSSFGKAFANAQKQLRLTEKQATQSNARLKALNKVVSRPTIKVRDLSGNTIGRVKSSLLSLQSVAAIALTAAGINKLGEATLGAAMNFEQYSIAMEHWLSGNKKAAQEYSAWLNRFANKTPFELDDVFPAGSRAVNVTGGDIVRAERLVRIAGNMAALTPGKTMQDAMEALADVNVGEYARLQEFGFKWKQELGSFEKFLLEADKKFAGGADKLSQTARGRLSTISDVIKTQFRSAGEGVLTAMSPRLQKITAWFDNHPKTVARWRTELIKLGDQAGEAVFSKLEKAFQYVQKNYIDNPKFTNLSFSGKVGVVLNDSLEGLIKWLDGSGGKLISSLMDKMGKIAAVSLKKLIPALEPVALALGTAIGNGILSGLKGAIVQGLQGDWGRTNLAVYRAATMGSSGPLQIWDLAQNINSWMDRGDDKNPTNYGTKLNKTAVDTLFRNTGDYSKTTYSPTIIIQSNDSSIRGQVEKGLLTGNADFKKKQEQVKRLNFSKKPR